ncbi:MAG: magnesium transporter CorA family protein [Saprospiraceae bacterium]
MIQYLIKQDNKILESDVLTPGCWVNIAAPFSHEELEGLSELFNIPVEFFTDSLDLEERARYEVEDDVRLIVINTPILNESGKENDAIYISVPIGIILTSDNLFTITSFENPVLDIFLENKIRSFDPSDQKLFVLQLFEQTVYRYLACLKKLNLKRNLIEEELYDSSRNSELIQLLRIEKSFVYFVSSLSSNELLKKKMKRTDFLNIAKDEDLQDLFEGIIIDNSQALEMSNVYTNILNGTMEAYSSIISNNLNVYIQRLTIITVILMVPTLVTSFYGMNVHLPFMESRYAAVFVIGISVMLSILLTIWFRRKNIF